jgi:murein DD-endopeptidase / murein LD-carboxypeptidase
MLEGKIMIEVPPHFFSVQYNGKHYPGAKNTHGLSNGTNCQHFVYELLRHFGKQLPNFRSSELWEDKRWTHQVHTFEPLDLLLYNSEPRAWGAHVGVYLGQDRIIHLSKDVGHPVIWSHQEFLSTARYKFFVGAKRIRDNAPEETNSFNTSTKTL